MALVPRLHVLIELLFKAVNTRLLPAASRYIRFNILPLRRWAATDWK